MKLQPMTDFVLEQYPKFNPFGSDKASKVFEYTYAYAKFLKQPLELGMFVPVDESGSVLEEPTMEKYGWYASCSLEEQSGWMYAEGEAKYYESLKQYEEAKEKVLFEGFMNVDTRKEGRIYFALKQSHRKNNIDYIMNDAFGLFFYNSSNERQRLNTIEDLLDFNELILTESAIKQIGL